MNTVQNKTEDLSISVFKMIIEKNESKRLTKHMLCKCKWKFDRKKCNSNQWWNSNKCWCECKKHNVSEKDYIWINPSTCNGKNGKYLATIMNDSAIMCNEIIESYDKKTKTVPTNFNEKNITCKTQNFYILLSFLLITKALLIVVSIYCYLIKCWAKQKHLLSFHVTNNKLKVKDMSIKTTQTTFLMILSIWKMLIQIILK